ncbi:MAG: hypothetical protein ACLQLG_14515 [Thermoguttaceae bacterium]
MAVFSEAFLRLRQDLDRSHESRRKLMEDIRNNVREMARQTGNQLAEQGASRRAEFTAMITELRSTIGRQAAETRGALADLAADLRQGGAVFSRRQPAARRNSRNR